MKYYVTIKSDEESLITFEDTYVIILNEIWFYKTVEKWLKGNIYCIANSIFG